MKVTVDRCNDEKTFPWPEGYVPTEKEKIRPKCSSEAEIDKYMEDKSLILGFYRRPLQLDA